MDKLTIIIGICSLWLTLNTVSAQFFQTCNQTLSLGPNQSKNLLSPGWPPYSYAAGSSCLYQITAPVDYQIRADCYIDMFDNTTNNACINQRFFVDVTGDVNLQSSNYYCGQNQTLSRISNGNQLTLAYASLQFNGIFNCSLTTVCDCGWSTKTRIVGGSNATLGEFPSMAGLVSLSQKKVYCGSTIISPRYVVTAAHCIDFNNNTADVRVLVGDIDLATGTDSQYSLLYPVQSFIKNPGYDPSTNYNDIGLVFTTTSIVWSKAVGPACLPFLNSIASFAGQSVTLLGWGMTSFAGLFPTNLQETRVNVISNSQCAQQFPSVISSQLCTFAKGNDSCQSDSGGPLLFTGPLSVRQFHVGIISEGDACATANAAVNTRTTTYLSWIQGIIGTVCVRSV